MEPACSVEVGASGRRRPTVPGTSFDTDRPSARTASRSHFKHCLAVVVRKNFLIKRRAWQATVMELILPVALMLLMVAMRLAVKREDVTQMSYVGSEENNPTWFSLRNVSEDIGEKLGPATMATFKRLCEGEQPTGLCPEIFAKATWVLRQEHFTGMALDGLMLLHLALNNQQIGVVGRRGLADFIESLPGYRLDDSKSYVHYFEDSAAFQAYIHAKDYGFVESHPQLFGAIEVRAVPDKGGDGKLRGDWDIVMHLNATNPNVLDPTGAGVTAVNTKTNREVKSNARRVTFANIKVYWSGGLLMTKGVPLSTGGFIDLQSLLYAWIYSTTGTFTLPSAEELKTSSQCECAGKDGAWTPDFRKCDPSMVMMQVLTPHWSTAKLGDASPIRGCLGRFSGLFPVSMREVPMPTVAHVKDKFADIVANVFGLFFTMVFLWPLTRIMKCMTEDKELRINEVMKMMGMPAEAITLGWYVTYGILALIPSVLIPIVCWTTVFRLSDKLLIAIFFWIFNVCVVTLCSLFAVFFEQSQTASVVGALLYFLAYFPYINVKDPNKAGKVLTCLFPPVAVSFGTAAIVNLESDGRGLQWSTLGEAVDGISVISVIAMMVLDIFLFAGLAWYLDKVMVVGFGTRQPWNFLFTRKYWNPGEFTGAADHSLEVTFDDQKPGNPRCEPVTPAVSKDGRILLRGLKKFFTTQEGQLLAAVQGLTANIYENMVFVLLGHNGAGKTTTFNMLSGMLPIDEGDAVIYGRSAKTDMPSIRKILGACPQHDVIWAQLTVKEHLFFYGAVKEVCDESLNVEVATTIADVGLTEKENSLAGTMSGGQKRRLSAAIALIGGSKVVFLDEPSSGVDPFSRRELWDCLKSKKMGRTIIMTTHFMDEAEELGDRIGIMAAGQIKCVGSSLFLKSQYGVGYTLVITKTPAAMDEYSDKPRDLQRHILSVCPSAQLLSDAGVERVYRMSLEDSKVFPRLFERFEQDGDALGVAGFCVSVTTLEEVFLRVGKDEADGPETAQERVNQRTLVRRLSTGAESTAPLGPPMSELGSSASFGSAESEIWSPNEAIPEPAPASSPKRGRAVISAGISASAALTGHNAQDLESQAENMRRPLSGVDPEDIPKGLALLASHVGALLEKRLRNSLRDRRAWCCQVGIPFIFLVFALGSLKFSGVGSYKVLSMDLHHLPGKQTVPYCTGDGVSDDAAAGLLVGLRTSSVELFSVGKCATTDVFDRSLMAAYDRGDDRSRYVGFRFQHVPEWGSDGSQTRKVGGFEVSDYRQPGKVSVKGPLQRLLGETLTVPVGTLWSEVDVLPMGPVGTVEVPMHELNNRLQVDVFWNTSATHAAPIFYNELHNQVMRLAMDRSKYDGEVPSVKLYNQPFPLSAAQKEMADSMTSLYLALAFAFIPASYGAFVVLERETNSKHLQIISGVNFVSYWVATWLWDLVNYIVPAAVSIVTIAAFGIDALVSRDSLFWTILCVMFYGLSCTSFTYMLSWLFKSHTSAQNTFVVIYLFTGGILEIVNIVLTAIPDTHDLMVNVLIYFFRLMPNFCLADALMNLILRKNMIMVSMLDCPRDGCAPTHMKIIGWDLVYMGVGSLVWFGITLALELAVATPSLQGLCRRKEPVVQDEELRLDQDVELERRRVLRGAADGEVIVLKGLRKTFPGREGVPPKVAVRDMFFGIPEGQCFGYLGMNGAGKTTTMKILTGEDLPSGGEATLGGFNIATDMQKVRQLIGYCPQFDALIGKLTAREHLKLFALIKGIPKHRIQSYVDCLLERLTLAPYADRQAATFSGGTKRKLSLGIALVGNPRIVFLDEPTTGVDPESRRFMWTLISSTMKGRSVILTTHSMDECEALCARIGIMVNGSLVCLGSAAHLKDRHGSGYQFDVTFVQGCDLEEAFRRLITFVRDNFKAGGRIMEGVAGSQRVKLRLPKGIWPMSGIFRIVEECRAWLCLAEYSVSETTLDQIFINFAKNQRDEATGVSIATDAASASLKALPGGRSEEEEVIDGSYHDKREAEMLVTTRSSLASTHSVVPAGPARCHVALPSNGSEVELERRAPPSEPQPPQGADGEAALDVSFAEPATATADSASSGPLVGTVSGRSRVALPVSATEAPASAEETSDSFVTKG